VGDSMSNKTKQVQMRGVKTKDDIYSLFKIVDKLEQRIATLEKVIGKYQLRVADIVYWIDNKLERKKDERL
jgi:exonuclease VII small subunit